MDFLSNGTGVNFVKYGLPICTCDKEPESHLRGRAGEHEPQTI